MKITIDWLDEINAEFKTINGTNHSLNIDDIFHTGFMAKHTQFSSIQEMFEESGYDMDEQDDLKKIANPTFDSFVAKTTNFSCWNEMITHGGKEFLKNRISDI